MRPLIALMLFFPMLAFGNANTDFKSDDPSVEEKNSTIQMPDHHSALRKREHSLSWKYSSGRGEIEIEGLAGSLETDSGESNISYGYNTGRFEPGIVYSSTVSKGEDTKSSVGLFTLYGRLNIIENIPGNDYIPYLALAFQSYAEEGESSGIDYDADGRGLAFQLGISIFPLSEIFAVEIGFFSSKISGDFKLDGSQSVDFDLKRSGLGIGYSIYF